MKYIRNIMRAIRNIIRWTPVIIKDRDYDDYYIFKLLEVKFKHMREFFESDDAWSANANKTAKQIRIAETLCRRICEDKYLSMALTDYSKKYGEDSPKIHTEPCENSKFRTLVWEWSEKEESDFKKAGKHSDYMVKQDVEYLFKHMNKYIKGWWD